MLSGSRTAVFARLVCFLALTSMSLAPSTGRAATDGNGFFDTYLAAIGYDARGSTPQAQEMTQDYLCDGEVSEETIVPQEGQLLQPPLTAADDPALCGSKPPARRGFDENALLDAGGLLPISVQAINNTTLDFRGIVRDATGMGGLTPSNVMAYAWVYVTNNTDAALDLTMGIGSDDSLQVEINRVEVFRHRGGRGSGGSGAIQDRFPVTLQPGGNLIQFKVWQGGGGWNMRARFETAGDCPLNARAPRDPIRSEEGGMITVDTVPVDVFEVTPSQRTIDASGASPNTVTANIRVTVDNQGAPWNLEETYDSGWELVTSNPAVSESVPGVARWNGVTAGEITYTLRRTDEWGPEDGTVAGRFTLGGAVSAVPGDAVIPGGLQPFVPEVLLTASLNIADFDELGNPADLDGCNVTPEQIRGAWIVGTAGGDAVTDASIVPSEGMAVQLDFGGLAGGMSQADSLSFISRDAETRYWADGIPEGAMILNRVTSGDGLYNFQRDDIYGPVDQTMNVAYFYALNLTGSARRLVIAFRSDDSGGVRVNGRSVHAITACRGTGSFDTADRFEAQLDPGKNLIACYTFERGGGYGMRIRFEDERFRPLRIPTTLDSAGYDPDPAAHPDPGELETFDSLFVPAVLVTAGFGIGGGFHGTNIPTRNIRGDWITGQDGNGDPVDDASIVPVEGMSLFPDFGGASQADGLTEIGQAGKDRFWTDPLDANVSGSLVVRVTSGDGFYNWQRGTIYGSSPDPNVTMNVAWFYAINEEAAPRCLTLSFGSDDSGGVRLNGRSVHAITVGRGTPAFAASDKVPVELGPGKNLIACYTFDNQGGWGLRVRFEDGDGNPVAVPTTTDPAGYDPDPAAHPAPGPDCSGEPAGDAYVRGGAANGIVSRFLVPRYVFEQIGGGRTNSMAAPENYVSQEGNPPAPDTIFEGAIIEAGVEGLADPFPPAITTGVRGSACGRNTLVLFDGLRDGDGPNDPGDFNSNNFYPNVVRTTTNTNNFSVSLFFFADNLTNDDLSAWFAFASDDGGSLYVNGNLLVEHLPGRGRGGNNVLQTFATEAAILEPGLNLVQFSYKQGGGGSGARVGFFADDCFSQAFPADQVQVTANPPGFVPGGDAPGAFRSLAAFGCDSRSSVTLTIRTPGGAPADVDLEETLPDGVTGANPSLGSFNAAGTVLTFQGRADDGLEITYDVEGASVGASYCEARINGAPIQGEDHFTKDTCPTRCNDLGESGAVPEMLIIGPIDLGGNSGPACDDNGNLEFTDYLADGGVDEENLAVGLGDELQPEFGGAAGGVGVKASPNPAINPRGDEGILTVWLADADADGRINFNDPDNVGNPVDDYVVYGLTYLENPTDFELPVTLEVGSDDAVKVRVNGELLHVNSVCRGIPAAGQGDRIIATLQPGRNSVLIAVVERGGGTGLRLIVRDEFDLAPAGGVLACRAGEGDEPPMDRFVRGDADSNGSINLTDGIVVLNFLFLGAGPPACLDAADTDDDGGARPTLTDAVIIFSWLFSGGAAPRDPSPNAPTYARETCGTDGTDDRMGCATVSQTCGV